MYKLFQQNILFSNRADISETRSLINEASRDIRGHKDRIEGLTKRMLKESLFYDKTFVIFSEMKDTKLTVDACSSNASSFFGYNQAEFMGLQLKDLMPKQIAERHD